MAILKKIVGGAGERVGYWVAAKLEPVLREYKPLGYREGGVQGHGETIFLEPPQMSKELFSLEKNPFYLLNRAFSTTMSGREEFDAGNCEHVEERLLQMGERLYVDRNSNKSVYDYGITFDDDEPALYVGPIYDESRELISDEDKISVLPLDLPDNVFEYCMRILLERGIIVGDEHLVRTRWRVWGGFMM